ncbi:HAMP domain-containing sensor histidine kinase [Ruminococcus sp.]|uniref:HAMP domain-containing sensor histidine kinase n=1 Tax=Ruminococcus sp. TaxID=41978 RepID=UPI0025F06966|nr:HAMP domain-containing sensor histidine kinase [Ruminococcus sp.]MBQ8966385.1 HAMP domain-containing histidine kinase [Ruminococcus sp.]
MRQHELTQAVKNSRFPKSIFFGYYVALLLLSGVHIGLLIGVEKANFNDIIIIITLMSYWALVAGGLTLYTRHQVRKTYELPMLRLADAAAKIAKGDFSARVETINEREKFDYLDQMIEDFNKMAAELGSIETLRLDFFSNVSHEIKTPIAVIQNSAEMLKKPDLSEEKRQEYVDTVTTAAKRLNTLITNILKLNKLEKQSITPHVSEFDLCDQLVQSALLFESVWEEKGIEFEADIADERKLITADAELLPLLWNNLLSNAFKFTEQGGTVTLREYTEDGRVVVEVEDSGCGMDEQTKKHIFDKFYQGDTSHSTEGNGLGLALALRVLQLTGGEISVESETGKGAKFIVTMNI